MDNIQEYIDYLTLVNTLLSRKPYQNGGICKVVNTSFFREFFSMLQKVKKLLIKGMELRNIKYYTYSSTRMMNYKDIQSTPGIDSHMLVSKNVIVHYDVIPIDEQYQELMKRLNSCYRFESLPEMFVEIQEIQTNEKDEGNEKRLKIKYIKQYQIINVKIEGLFSGNKNVNITVRPNESFTDFQTRFIKRYISNNSQYTIEWKNELNQIIPNDCKSIPLNINVTVSTQNSFTSSNKGFGGFNFKKSIF